MTQVLDWRGDGAGLEGGPALPRAPLQAAAGLLAYAALLAAGWWALLHAVPDAVTLRSGVHAVRIAGLHDKVIGNAGAVMAVLPVALAVEWGAVGWTRSSIRRLLRARSPSVRTDLAVLALGQAKVLDVLGRVMMLGASLVSGAWLHDRLAAHGFLPDFAAAPWAAQFAAAFVAYSLLDYWTHRIDHTHLFWPLHRFHHSAEEFAVVTAARQHPVALVGVFVINLPLSAAGAPADVLLWVNVAVNALGFLLHSEIESDWGWVGRWVLQSPLHHRLHHKLSMETPTGHFGLLPVWDRLFGTWTGGERPGLPIGVAARYRHGFWIAPDLLRDYWDFWRGVAGRRAPE